MRPKGNEMRRIITANNSHKEQNRITTGREGGGGGGRSKTNENGQRQRRIEGKEGKRKGGNRPKGRGERRVKLTSVLSIVKADDTDSGEYSCRGVSVVGHASAKLSLSVVPREYYYYFFLIWNI